MPADEDVARAVLDAALSPSADQTRTSDKCSGTLTCENGRSSTFTEKVLPAFR
jgi:hypothetical protein